MKKKFALLLAAAMTLSALAGCGPKPGTSSSAPSSGSDTSAPGSSSVSSTPAGSSSEDSSADTSVPAVDAVEVMVLSGPTGVGAAQLITTHALNSNPHVAYNFTVATENPEVVNALINGDADIAAVATNVASNLVNKTDGGVQVLAINTLGVLYILEKGDTVHTMSDLRGKTLYAPSTAKGSNPEFILNYLLEENDVDPDQVNIEWLTPQEITAKMASSDSGVCMLPVPAATALLLKDSGVREAISLSAEWDKLENGALAQGCIVARTDFIENNPDVIASFLADYEASVSYMNDEANRQQAADMVATLGITANAAIAAKAIPQCNLTYIAGGEMKDILESFCQIMYQADPASIGGAMPYDSFYYGAE